MAYAPQQKVIEVVEYIDDDDYDGDDSDYEEVVEIVEQVVTVPKKFFSPVAAWEVGIGAPPPAFLTPKEKAKFVEQDLLSSAEVTVPTSTTTSTGPSFSIATNGSTPISPTKTSPRGIGRPSKRLSTKRHLSIVNNALGLPDDHELSDYEEEIIEEDIIEEEYYDEEEIIEEEYYEEEYIEEDIKETEDEAKERRQLEEEIAAIERLMEEAKQAKEKRLAEGGEVETSKEKAQRMAHNSRLQACKQMKVESDFKRKAAAKAKILAEKEQNWGVKGKKKQKDLMEIIAAKAKKQKKLLSRQRSKDYTKQPLVPKEAPKVEEKPAENEEPAEAKKPLSLSDMLVKKKAQGIGGAHVGKVKAPVAQNLRAADDFGDDDLRAEDFLPSDSEEEEEEKVLSPEEEHKKSLEWEKPAWTLAKLKTTVKGTQVKKGKTLAAPITNIPKKINEGLEDDDNVNQPSAGALVKGAIAIVQLPKVKKHQANLKFTGNGARIRDGRKIEKQINPKVSQKEEVKIWGADPEDLKLTPRGLTARKGKGLSDDNITQATQIKKYQFEKPDWAKTKPSHLLKATETGEHLKEGEDIAPKITEATTQKKYEFEKPTWTKAQLKSTDKGSKLKSGEYLSKPIVDLGRKTMNVNSEANPAFLRMTDNGEKLLEGETNLAGPITEAPQLAKRG